MKAFQFFYPINIHLYLFAVETANISIEGTYKNLKYQDNNIWRITKISSDLVVTINPVAI